MREILAALNTLARTRPQDVALTDPAANFTYAEMAGRVAALARDFAALPDRVALLAPNSALWVFADLALALAGKTFIPLPTFFSPGQLSHIVKDAGVGHVLCVSATAERAKTLGLPISVLTEDGANAPFPTDLAPSVLARRIIYTSGTTGTPKGVRLGDRQITASARGLLAASRSGSRDRYLSVLPFSLLLEQIAAICVPLLAGAQVVIAPDAAGAAQMGDPRPLIAAFATHRPSVSVLVPALLGAWVQGLAATNGRAPDSLRFVAVGGAHVPLTLAESAWRLGIPAHEGYGLSECCSVVSVNRPGGHVAGTVGRVLEGLTVAIEDGEIVVHGATVMDGYLGRQDIHGHTWRTGDVGEFTQDGLLCVLGRKDRLIVTPEGRNIHPEWIETLALGAPGVLTARLSLIDGADLTLDIAAAPNAPRDLEASVRARLAEAPRYAQPARIVITSPMTAAG